MNRSHVISGIVAAALFIAPLSAFGQATTTTTTTTTQTTTVDIDYATTNHSIVSGAVGGAFGGDADEGSLSLDASYDYLHRGAYGFEFLANFSPDFNLDAAGAVAAGDTTVNTYMFNAIGAIPLGLDDNWMPYASGGFGLISVNNDFSVEGTDLDIIDHNQFGTNVGFGVMAFANQVGFRADVRYFSGIGTSDSIDLTDPNQLDNLTEDVNFWRSTVGISFRW